MTKPTRLFLTIAGGILVLGLGAGVVASYYLGGFQGLSLVGTDGPDELRYVPGEARMLAFVNVREVMDSEVRKAIHAAAARPGQQQPRGWQAEIGLDPERDIDQIVLWSSGAERQPPLVLARGRFDTVKLEGWIRERGGRVETYAGTRVLLPGEGSMAVGLLEPGLIAAGPVSAIRQSLDSRADNRKSVTANTDVMRLVREAQPGSAWAVSRFDTLAAHGRLPDGVASRLPPISWLSATARVNGGVEGTLRAETRDETAAKDLREVLQGFVALARLQAGPESGQIASALNALQLGGAGKNVSIQFNVPSELVGRLATMQPPRRPVPPPPAPPPPAQP